MRVRLLYGKTLSFISVLTAVSHNLAQKKCHILAYELKYVITLITIKPFVLQEFKKKYSIHILCWNSMEFSALRFVLTCRIYE